MEKKLTDKQAAFCREYLIDLNATAAAKRAGYSEKTARDIACENLAKPNIAQEITRLQEERNKRLDLNADFFVKNFLELHDIGKKGDEIHSSEGALIGIKRQLAPAVAALTKAAELCGHFKDIGGAKGEAPINKIQIEVIGADAKN